MAKKLSRIIAALMLILAIAFIAYALNHPEAGFPWNNAITYVLYIVYLAVMIVLFIAPFRKNK